MTQDIQDTLLQLFESMNHDTASLPTVPLDGWQVGSAEWQMLDSFRRMVQQRMTRLEEAEKQLREKEEETEQMSLVTSPSTIPAAFVTAEHIVHPNGLWVVGPDRRWNPVNEQQRRYLEIFEIVRKEVTAIPEIEAKSAFVAEVLNEFLRVHGFPMELEPFTPDEFGVAAVFQVVLAWFKTGKAQNIVRSDGKTYPGVLMEHDMAAFTVPGHENPVISLPTKTADIVYLTMIEKPADEFAMIATARQIYGNQAAGEDDSGSFPDGGS